MKKRDKTLEFFYNKTYIWLILCVSIWFIYYTVYGNKGPLDNPAHYFGGMTVMSVLYGFLGNRRHELVMGLIIVILLFEFFENIFWKIVIQGGTNFYAQEFSILMDTVKDMLISFAGGMTPIAIQEYRKMGA